MIQDSLAQGARVSFRLAKQMGTIYNQTKPDSHGIIWRDCGHVPCRKMGFAVEMKGKDFP